MIQFNYTNENTGLRLSAPRNLPVEEKKKHENFDQHLRLINPNGYGFVLYPFDNMIKLIFLSPMKNDTGDTRLLTDTKGFGFTSDEFEKNIQKLEGLLKTGQYDDFVNGNNTGDLPDFVPAAGDFKTVMQCINQPTNSTVKIENISRLIAVLYNHLPCREFSKFSFFFNTYLYQKPRANWPYTIFTNVEQNKPTALKEVCFGKPESIDRIEEILSNPSILRELRSHYQAISLKDTFDFPLYEALAVLERFEQLNESEYLEATLSVYKQLKKYQPELFKSIQKQYHCSKCLEDELNKREKQREKNLLENSKEKHRNEIDQLINGTSSSNVRKAVAQAKKEIDNAASLQALEAAYTRNKRIIQNKLNTELNNARSEAQADLRKTTNQLAKHPSENVKNLLNEYIRQIESADKVETIETIKAKGKQSIESKIESEKAEAKRKADAARNDSINKLIENVKQLEKQFKTASDNLKDRQEKDIVALKTKFETEFETGFKNLKQKHKEETDKFQQQFSKSFDKLIQELNVLYQPNPPSNEENESANETLSSSIFILNETNPQEEIEFQISPVSESQNCLDINTQETPSSSFSGDDDETNATITPEMIPSSLEKRKKKAKKEKGGIKILNYNRS